MFDSGGRASQRLVTFDAKPRAQHVGASSLIEDDVYDPTGKRMGEVEEIILDIRTGCARYVVLSFGGFMGIGRKHVAVPWSALTPDLDYHRCVLDVAALYLMSVPVVNEDPWLQRYDPSQAAA
ncbi:MAG: PRC-barrel domain-containing protein [Casimicrobiaceae bacterium]